MPIVSISTFFKRNIATGETNIFYMNGTRISIHLNELGLYCGPLKYYNMENELMKVEQVDEDLEWVRKCPFYFILVQNHELTNILSSVGNHFNKSGKSPNYKIQIQSFYITLIDFKFLIICKYVGENFAFKCKKNIQAFTSTGFPSQRIVEESKYEEILGLHFPTGSSELKYENKEEFIDLCKNNENLDTWLDIIAKKPYVISGYSEVCNSIKKCPNKSYVY